VPSCRRAGDIATADGEGRMQMGNTAALSGGAGPRVLSALNGSGNGNRHDMPGAFRRAQCLMQKLALCKNPRTLPVRPAPTARAGQEGLHSQPVCITLTEFVAPTGPQSSGLRPHVHPVEHTACLLTHIRGDAGLRAGKSGPASGAHGAPPYIGVVYAVVEAKVHVQPVVRTVRLPKVGVTGDVCITELTSSQWCA